MHISGIAMSFQFQIIAVDKGLLTLVGGKFRPPNPQSWGDQTDSLGPKIRRQNRVFSSELVR